MHWKERFRFHLIKLEKYFQPYKPPFKNDIKVYLAGYVARYSDTSYINQIQPFLFRDAGEIKKMIIKHHDKLGQNAPLIFYARINAEYRMYRIIKEKTEEKTPVSILYSLQLKEPASLFSVASTYSRIAGMRYQALLYEILYKRIQEVLEILSDYFRNVTSTDNDLTMEVETIPEDEMLDFYSRIRDTVDKETHNITEKDYRISEITEILKRIMHLS